MAGYGSNPNSRTNETNYLYRRWIGYSMSPYGSSSIANVARLDNGYIDSYDTYVSGTTYPVINLKADNIVTGNGTVDNPYVVQ